MTEQSEQEIGTFFDECARNGFMETFDSNEIIKLRNMLDQWDIKPGHTILEPGCGSGRLTEYLAEAVGSEGKVVACDLSRVMIQKVLQRNLPKHVTVYCGSAARVPVEDNYFDKILCFQVFPHFIEKERTLTELARVLKTGGDLWINHLKSKEEINNIHRHASRVVISHHLPPDEDMYRLLSQNGFNVKFIRNSIDGYHLHAEKK